MSQSCVRHTDASKSERIRTQTNQREGRLITDGLRYTVVVIRAKKESVTKTEAEHDWNKK